MAKFSISTRSNGEFQFRLEAEDGQVMLSSEGYGNKAGCVNGVESVRKNSADDARYEAKTSANGKFYFNLNASNGQVIGTSPMFGTEANCSEVMALVKASATSAPVEDSTGS
jgi:uncharacterized protein